MDDHPRVGERGCRERGAPEIGDPAIAVHLTTDRPDEVPWQSDL